MYGKKFRVVCVCIFMSRQMKFSQNKMYISFNWTICDGELAVDTQNIRRNVTCIAQEYFVRCLGLPHKGHRELNNGVFVFRTQLCISSEVTQNLARHCP